MSYYRRADTRGFVDLGWLQSRHSFSFGSWYDPAYMGESVLRVINDDTVSPGAGFGTHGHRDMEILSYVVQGTMEHRDSMGHVQRMTAGEFQLMSAGTGVTHSEYNASTSETLKFLQIWILPRQAGLTPGYQQRSFPREEDQEGRRLVVSPDGREGSLQIHQDVELYLLRPQAGQALSHDRGADRGLYLHLVKGSLQIGEHLLTPGDAYFLDDQQKLELRAESDSEALLFDLPTL